MRGAFSPWHVVLVAIVILVLFGAGKLPGFARSLGQSLRIFKAETKAMKDDDNELPTATPPAQIAGMAQTPVAVPVTPVQVPVAAPATAPAPASVAAPAPTVYPTPTPAAEPTVSPEVPGSAHSHDH